MISQILAFLSLSYFLVSPKRKVRLLMTLALLGIALYFPSVGDLPVPFIDELLRLAIVFLATYSIVTIVRFAIITGYRRRNNLKLGSFDNVIVATDSTASVIIFLVTFGSVFPIFGIPFNNFLASLGLVAVGLAIMLRDYAKNFIDGFRILYTRDFLIGDYVKTKNGQIGVITNISFRATKIKTMEGDTAYIPNSTMMNGEMVNYSKSQHTISIPMTVDIEKICDLEAFEQHIVDRLREQRKVKSEQKIKFLVQTLEKDTANISIEISVKDYSFKQEATLKNCIIRFALEYIRERQPSSGEKTIDKTQ